MGADFDAGRLPEVEGVGSDEVRPHCDKFDARTFGESKDVFWGPVGVSVEGIDDGFPGV